MKRSMLLPSAIVVFLNLLQCGSDNGTGNPPENIEDPGTRTGTTAIVTIAHADEWADDTITGARFSSDAAGDTLEISRIEGMDVPPVEGIVFSVENRGSGRLRIAVPRSDSNDILLYGWGPFTGAGTGKKDSLRWNGIAPVNADTDTVVFDIPDPDESGLYHRAMSSWSGFSRFSLSVVKGGSTAATTLAHFHTLAARAILTLLDTLPSPLEEQTQEKVLGTHRYSLTITSSPYYKGLWHVLGYVRHRGLVALGENSDQGSVAHEMGHYFSHVLAGDDRYALLEELAPDGDHGLGVEHRGRTTITEEYAYFTEYFMTGVVGGAADPLVVQIFLGKQVQPSKVDMPSVEGFGTILLAMLQRHDSTVIDFEKKKDTLPILGASFGELYSVLAPGPSTITELREGLAALCTKHAFDTGWQVCAEAAGWSYHGDGKVVGSDGKAVSDAGVFCALPVDGMLKPTCAPVKSDAQGKFSLSRLYPGKAKLYAVIGGDTATAATDISWDKETDGALTLPDIVVTELTIASLTPEQGYEADTVVLSGRGFGASRETSAVYFGAKKAVSYPVWSDTLIKVRIPNGARPGDVTVTVGSAVSTGKPFTVLSATARDLRTAKTLSVTWRGTHEFTGPSGTATDFEAFTVATNEIGSGAPSVIWSGDSFHVAFDGKDAMGKKVQFTVKGSVNPWGDTLTGAVISYSSMSADSCESGTVPTYTFAYTLKNIRLYDYNTTFKRVQYRVAGDTISVNVENPSMTNVACNGTTTYVSTHWSEGEGTTDIEVDFEWE